MFLFYEKNACLTISIYQKMLFLEFSYIFFLSLDLYEIVWIAFFSYEIVG